MKSWLWAAFAAVCVLALVFLYGTAMVGPVIAAAVFTGLWVGLRRLPAKHAWMPAVAVFAVVIMFAPGFAFADTINIGQAFSTSLQPYIDAIVSALLALLVGYALYAAQKYLGIKAEEGLRQGLTQFLQRQASSLVADGMVKLSGVKIEVSSPALAAAANTALTAVPDAMNKFGLTPEKVQGMIIDMLPKEPSVAAAQAVAIDVANPATPSTAAPAAA